MNEMPTQVKISNNYEVLETPNREDIEVYKWTKSASKLLFVKNEFCNIVESSFLITFANPFQIAVPISLYRSQI